MSKTDDYRTVLEEIYDNARNGFTGVCRWCSAPPPTEETDHDVACPAAKAGWALDKPGYHDWLAVAERAKRPSKLLDTYSIDATYGDDFTSLSDNPKARKK